MKRKSNIKKTGKMKKWIRTGMEETEEEKCLKGRWGERKEGEKFIA